MKRPTVLVVEDEVADLHVVLSALQGEYSVIAAADGADAMLQLQAHAPSLILLGLSPRNAAAFCARLRADEKGSDTPLVVMTPPVGKAAALLSPLHPAADYIQKPVDPCLLKLRIRNSLALKEQRDLLALQQKELDRALAAGGARGKALPEQEGEPPSGALGRASREWQATFDSVSDLVSVIDTTHTIRRANRAMAQSCGHAPDTPVGRKCYEVNHGASGPHPDCPLVQMLRDGVVRTVQISENSGGRVFDVTVSPVRDEGGTITGCIHVAHDVTAKVVREVFGSTGQEILRILGDSGPQGESLQRVVSLVKAAAGVDAVGIRLQDGDDYPFLYHEGLSSDFIEAENSLVARGAAGSICRDDCGNICLECTCGLVISGKGATMGELLTSGGSFWTNDASESLHAPIAREFPTTRRNECVHRGFASVAIVPIRAKGRIVGALLLNGYRTGCFSPEMIETLENVAKNIGEALLRKQAEEKLIASERFLRTLTEQLPGVVGYWTRELRCGFANKAYLGWFGVSPESLVGRTMPEVLGADLFRKNEPHVRAVLRGEPQRFERSHPRPGGDVGYGLVHYIPDVVDGVVRGFSVLVSDVTELKRAEEEKVKLEVQLQQAQKMESIGRLAGGVAHDFNNMLGVIIGRAELAMQRTDHSNTYEGLVEIRDVAERSANLTRQLLAFARKQTILPKDLDLNETISGMIKMLQRLIGEGIQLTWLPEPDLWRVHADPGQIDQLLANLCVNARDAITSTGRITIRTQNSTLDERYCREHPDAAPGEYVRLTVTDDGCGMEHETLENIFEPFYTTKELGRGTGLGLATVFGIVKQNNGSIAVFSAPGQGTTFSLFFPRLVEKRAVLTPQPAAPALPTGRETVLLVEDEPTILEMAAMMLQHQGYTVLKAGGAGEALKVGQEHRGALHLLLTDVIMPEMNGKDLAAQIAGSRPGLKCLFMSGYSPDAIAGVGVLEDATHFMQKPFTLASLATMVRQVLDR